MKRVIGGSFIVLLFALFFVFTLSAHAELYNRGTDSLGNQLIYDSDLNITWYDYTRAPDYQDLQMDWAVALDIDFNGTHYTDWRLPTCLDQDGAGLSTSSTCTNSEMSHLYYSELGNPAGTLINTGDFQHLQPLGYWSGTSYSGISLWAWGFGFNNGSWGYMPISIPDNAIAVRPGDVGPIAVDIDIKPDSYPNNINLKSKGVIPVAILTTEDFDATIIDPQSVLLGPSETEAVHYDGHIEDADDDGDLDLVLHFKTKETGIECGDIEAGLTGETFDGQAIEGFDYINTKRCD